MLESLNRYTLDLDKDTTLGRSGIELFEEGTGVSRAKTSMTECMSLSRKNGVPFLFA